jgi:hypothetical protein
MRWPDMKRNYGIPANPESDHAPMVIIWIAVALSGGIIGGLVAFSLMRIFHV